MKMSKRDLGCVFGILRRVKRRLKEIEGRLKRLEEKLGCED